ncbi:MAG TPA: right-handed parallel beta-helix repeat-containing protein, partial [Anaerolineales bacterium]|nr:right-handed parallel beta-helix repeat-containing protein [Anaerolineales bacterium]
MSTTLKFITKRRTMRARIGTLLLALVLVCSLVGLNHTSVAAAGTTYYVDNTNASCSDTNPSAGTAVMPFCTITVAANKATIAGDTVNVVHGTYAETVYPASGSAVNPITFHAVNSDVTVTGNAAGFGSAFAVSAKSYVVIDGFNVFQTKFKGIYVDSSDHITISNNHVSYTAINAGPDQHQQGIFLRATTYSTISGNTTEHNGCTGIRLTNGSNNNTISNNLSYWNSSTISYPVVVITDAAGIDLFDSNYNTIIHNITRGNEDTGINLYIGTLGTGSTHNLVIDNLTYANG